MTTVKIYAFAELKPIGCQRTFSAQEIVFRIIRRYRKLGMRMVFFEEDAFGSTVMKFAYKDE